MFAVLVGAARYVNCYHGVKSAPNAEWFLDISKGPNPGNMMALKFTHHDSARSCKCACELGAFASGCLSLKAKTRNSCGITSKTEILVSYGLQYDLSGTKPLC